MQTSKLGLVQQLFPPVANLYDNKKRPETAGSQFRVYFHTLSLFSSSLFSLPLQCFSWTRLLLNIFFYRLHWTIWLPNCWDVILIMCVVSNQMTTNNLVFSTNNECGIKFDILDWLRIFEFVVQDSPIVKLTNASSTGTLNQNSLRKFHHKKTRENVTKKEMLAVNWCWMFIVT